MIACGKLPVFPRVVGKVIHSLWKNSVEKFLMFASKEFLLTNFYNKIIRTVLKFIARRPSQGSGGGGGENTDLSRRESRYLDCEAKRSKTNLWLL